MKHTTGKLMKILLLSTLITVNVHAQYQNQSAYPNGQAVFVQQPYASSVYTEYRYSPNGDQSNRLPPYTTNQAVFVQQPYGGAQQTVTSYPTRNRYGTSYTESRYSNPSNYPSTTGPAYPFGTVRSYTASPYPTTSQYPMYNRPNTSGAYTTTETYPYTSTRQVIPPVDIQQQGRSYSYYPNSPYPVNGTYTTNPYPANSYPNTTYQSPYPFTTAIPETTIPPATLPPNTSNADRYYPVSKPSTNNR